MYVFVYTYVVILSVDLGFSYTLELGKKRLSKIS